MKAPSSTCRLIGNISTVGRTRRLEAKRLSSSRHQFGLKSLLYSSILPAYDFACSQLPFPYEKKPPSGMHFRPPRQVRACQMLPVRGLLVALVVDLNSVSNGLLSLSETL